jgi:hypothetical protein
MKGAMTIGLRFIQGVFEVEAFLLTCDSTGCSKEF